MAVIVSFAILLAVGLTTFRDYGISTNEIAYRRNHQKQFTYLKTLWQNARKNVRFDQDEYTHGMIFELGARYIEDSLGLKDGRERLFERHLLGFLAFFLAALASYAIYLRAFGSWWLAYVGTVFLVLIPQLYCDAFLNGVDIPFFSFYTVATWTLIRYLDKADLKNAILHAVASGFAMGMRLAGGMMVLTTVLFAAGQGVLESRRAANRPLSWMRLAVTLAAYLAVSAELLFLLWPVLWFDPMGTLPEALRMSLYASGDVAWQQTDAAHASPVGAGSLPVWMMATTPPLFGILFVAGLGAALYRILRPSPGAVPGRRDVLLFFCLLFTPFALSLVSHTVDFGLLRHFYFILPAAMFFVLCGLSCVVRLIRSLQSIIWRRLLAATAIIAVGVTIADAIGVLVEAHTYERVYRSELCHAWSALNVSDPAVQLEERCTAERKALEYIVSHDNDPVITVYGTFQLKHSSCPLSAVALLPSDRRRLFVGQPAVAKYAVCAGPPVMNDRCCVVADEDGPRQLAVKEKCFSLTFRGQRVITVYRLW